MREAEGFLIRRDARLGVRRAACRREALGGVTKGCRRAGVQQCYSRRPVLFRSAVGDVWVQAGGERAARARRGSCLGSAHPEKVRSPPPTRRPGQRVRAALRLFIIRNSRHPALTTRRPPLTPPTASPAPAHAILAQLVRHASPDTTLGTAACTPDTPHLHPIPTLDFDPRSQHDTFTS